MPQDYDNATSSTRKIADRYPAVLLDAFEQPPDDHEAELFYCNELCSPDSCWCACYGRPVLNDPEDFFLMENDSFHILGRSIPPDWIPDVRDGFYAEEYEPPEMVYCVHFY